MVIKTNGLLTKKGLWKWYYVMSQYH